MTRRFPALLRSEFVAPALGDPILDGVSSTQQGVVWPGDLSAEELAGDVRSSAIRVIHRQEGAISGVIEAFDSAGRRLLIVGANTEAGGLDGVRQQFYGPDDASFPGDWAMYAEDDDVLAGWDESEDKFNVNKDVDFNNNELQAPGTIVGFVTLGQESLTVASGEVTATKSYLVIAGESAAADNLHYINGGSVGSIVTLRILTATQPITMKYASTQLALSGAADFAMTSTRQTLTLIRLTSTIWSEIGRST